MQLLRVGKRLEQDGVIFVDLWPQVLSFCGRGWFEVEDSKALAIDNGNTHVLGERRGVGNEPSSDDDYLALPCFR